MKKSYFIVSLDTELMWGPTTIEDYHFLKKNKKNVRGGIDKLLNIFEKYQISSTWAVVGHLFLDSCCQKNCLTNENINNFKYIKKWYHDPYTNIKINPLFYGSDIIGKIINCKQYQEIGYHSYSHPRLSECPHEMVLNEIKKVEEIRKDWNLNISSFVYPRNEIVFPELLRKYGFTVFRGPDAGIYDPNDRNIFVKKIKGGVNKIIAPPVLPIISNKIWRIDSSLFFCDRQMPYSVIPRGKIGLIRAIKSKKIFHICLHPWNLLLYRSLLYDLEVFLRFVSKRIEKGLIYNITMDKIPKIMDGEI